MSTSVGSGSVDAFKEAQVHYRRIADLPDRLDDLHELVDFSNSDADDRIQPVFLPSPSDGNEHHYTGPLFTLKGYEGFLYAPQVLSQELQLQMAYGAVTTYCEHPHKTNIDLIPPRPSEIANDTMSLWELWKYENGFQSKLRNEWSSIPTFGSDQRWYRSFHKLAWATLGYNYDWTARAYHPDDVSPMPCDLVRLSQYFARAAVLHEQSNQSSATSRENGSSELGQSSLSNSSNASSSFDPSAGIVNYYNTKSIMGGHRDDSEFALDKPIVSFSTGRPAVFLLGGPTRDDPNITALLVRPGDVMMMGGSTRLNYHAMARLLPTLLFPPPSQKAREMEMDNAASATTTAESQPASLVPIQLDTSIPGDELPALLRFLELHRININLRQVFPS